MNDRADLERLIWEASNRNPFPEAADIAEVLWEDGWRRREEGRSDVSEIERLRGQEAPTQRKPTPSQVCSCGDSRWAAIGTCPPRGHSEYALCPQRRTIAS
jgi:hypothetical protein